MFFFVLDGGGRLGEDVLVPTLDARELRGAGRSAQEMLDGGVATLTFEGCNANGAPQALALGVAGLECFDKTAGERTRTLRFSSRHGDNEPAFTPVCDHVAGSCGVSDDRVGRVHRIWRREGPFTGVDLDSCNAEGPAMALCAIEFRGQEAIRALAIGGFGGFVLCLSIDGLEGANGKESAAQAFCL